MRTISQMQIDLGLALSLPGEAEIFVLSLSTDELVDRVTIVDYNDRSFTGQGHEFWVRDACGEISSRSAVDLGLTEGGDRIAFFASEVDIAPISA